jgi:hypothetical protein
MKIVKVPDWDGKAVRFANTHLRDDETVAKMGHPELLVPQRGRLGEDLEAKVRRAGADLFLTGALS